MQALSITIAKVEFIENDTDSLDLRFILDILLTSGELRWEKYFKTCIFS